MSSDLSTEFCGIEMKNPIMNASGILSHADVILRHANYLGAGVLKSIGTEERQGNQPPIFYYDVNAVGLPNPGYENIREELREYYPKFQEKNLPLIVSIFANSPDKLAEVAETLNPFCDALELNYSCPNIEQGETAGITIGKDPHLTSAYTRAVRKATQKPLIAKMTPAVHIFDRKLGVDIARAAKDEGVDAISAINTVPGAMRIDVYAKRPVLSAKYGGLSGRGIMPLGVGYIYSLFEALGCDTPLVGIGGIETARDIVEYVQAGANAVAIGTALKDKTEEQRLQYLSDLETGLQELLNELGADSLMELRGVAHN